MEKFQAFLLRASTSRSIFGAASSASQTRQVILLEDLPNILHPETQKQFHEALQLFVRRSTAGHLNAAPVVIVISDAGMRGESAEDGTAGQKVWKSKEAADVRSVVPPDLLNSPYVTQIRFVGNLVQLGRY
jgi:cell cycle checkpoint protein